ncbi:hypothetical protein IP69_14790 [Bosea sp. AAP35]|nr:hypothetical protein IP69_14790 [Bosea sp. AAP35]
MTLKLAERLREELGAENIVLFLRTKNAELQQFRDAGLTLHLADVPSFGDLLRRGFGTLRLMREQAEAIARIQPTRAVFTMNFPLAWPLVHVLQRRGLSVAYVAHDADPHPGDYAQIWQRSTQGMLLRFSDRIIVLSDHTRQVLAARFPRRADRLRQASLQSIMRPRVDDHRELVQGRPVRLLFLGRLVQYKGLDLLAEALAPLRGRSDWTLTIAGDGPLRSTVAAAFGDWPNVNLALKWLDPADFDDLLRTHDVVLCPYTEASQSGVVAEAMTFGVPAFVMPNGELPNQIGQGKAGAVATAPTAEAFRVMVKAALDEPASLRQMSIGALQLAKASSSGLLSDVLLS